MNMNVKEAENTYGLDRENMGMRTERETSDNLAVRL